MNNPPDDAPLQDLAARLAQEEQANAALRAQLAQAEHSSSGTAPAASYAPSAGTINTRPPLPVRGLPLLKRRRVPLWAAALLVVLVLAIGVSVSVLLISRSLKGTPYRGTGYTITPLPGWQTQPDKLGGVIFLDPRFTDSATHRASQLGVLVGTFDALFFEYGSMSRALCRGQLNVPTTANVAGRVWIQRQYTCNSFQQGGIASQIRILDITYDVTNTHYSIFYVAALDRLDDFTNGSFDTITQSFTFNP